MALTGLTWSFSWYRTGFYKVFGVETAQGGGGHGAPAQTAAHGGDGGQGRSDGRPGTENRERKPFSPFANWQKVYEELKELNPDYKQITVFKGSATVSFNRLGNQRAADRYTFNPRSGEITGLPYIRMPTLQENPWLDILRSCRQLGRADHPHIEFPCRFGRGQLAADGLLSLDSQIDSEGQ